MIKLRYFFLVVCLLFSGMLFSQTYNITVSVSPEEGGIVRGAGSYAENETVTLEAESNSGYFFVNWTENDEVVSSEATYEFAATADRTLVANFEEGEPAVTYIITATAGRHGSITPSGEVSVAEGADITFTIEANPGYQTASLLVDGAEVNVMDTYTFTNVLANHTIAATFESMMTGDGQAPQTISYQAVVRGGNNMLICNKQISLQMSLLQGSANGDIVYMETHNPTTDGNGFFSIEIGAGETDQNFMDIDWSRGPFYVRTEIDPEGNWNYSIVAINKLLTVPYALYALKAGNAEITTSEMTIGEVLAVDNDATGRQIKNIANPTDAQDVATKAYVDSLAMVFRANIAGNRHEYVDLGLPSGLKWATTNIGAINPEDYGNYFAWGETEMKDYYAWDTYEYGEELTKYNETDGLSVLDSSDDAASVIWGNVWRMPTQAEMQELVDNCTWTWTTQNGVNGYLVTGTNDNSIFMPAAGYFDETLLGFGTDGNYWSSSLKTDDTGYAWNLEFFAGDNHSINSNRRIFGCAVRPVYSENTTSYIPTVTTAEISNITSATASCGGNATFDGGAEITARGVCWSTTSNPTIDDDFTADGTGTGEFTSNITGLADNTIYFVRAYATNSEGTAYGEEKIFRTNGVVDGYEYVDLGLPSGLKWATVNVGATNPEDYGDYYAWGETLPRSEYTEDNHTFTDEPAILGSDADAATVNWGGEWRMPTYDEFQELIDECTWELSELNGVSGYRVTSNVNSNSIFLPYAGVHNQTDYESTGSNGFYWSSSYVDGSVGYSWFLFLGSENIALNYYQYRNYTGLPIRPVYGDGHEYVDLGLPSGLKWATANIGASNPEDGGDFFAWGETETKEDFSWDTYKWGTQDDITMYNETDGLTVLKTVDDAAAYNWGGKWRMPTETDMQELVEYCTWTWTDYGYKVEGRNGNFIFLPASGYRSGTGTFSVGSEGQYWSGSVIDSRYAWLLYFGSDGHGMSDQWRVYGLSVRAVRP